MYNIKLYYIASLLFGFIFVFLFFKKTPTSSIPTPTEYVEKKKNKKEFKKNRKEWIENMHRTHPDDDWREIDRAHRKRNTDAVQKLRNVLLNDNRYEDILDNHEVISQSYRCNI